MNEGEHRGHAAYGKYHHIPSMIPEDIQAISIAPNSILHFSRIY